MKSPFSQIELDFIRNNANIMKDKDVAAFLTRISGRYVSINSVRHARTNLGIRKEPGRGVSRVASYGRWPGHWSLSETERGHY